MIIKFETVYAVQVNFQIKIAAVTCTKFRPSRVSPILGWCYFAAFALTFPRAVSSTSGTNCTGPLRK